MYNRSSSFFPSFFGVHKVKIKEDEGDRHRAPETEGTGKKAKEKSWAGAKKSIGTKRR